MRTARRTASELVATIRELKFSTCVAFRENWPTRKADTPFHIRANHAYDKKATAALTAGFTKLDGALQEAGGPPLQRLINTEVVLNAFTIDRPTVPPVFDFIHMSAGVRNALGHPDATPEDKLAGIKLNHFAGFLKRSWRASDWMWGRLDGTQHLLAALLDLDLLTSPPNDTPEARASLFASLADFAFPDQDGPLLSDAWQQTINWARDGRVYPDSETKQTVAERLDDVVGLPAAQQFSGLLTNSAGFAHDTPNVAEVLLDCCRMALAARIQLAVLAEELPVIRRTVGDDLQAGASRNTSGVEWAATPTGQTNAACRPLPCTADRERGDPAR